MLWNRKSQTVAGSQRRLSAANQSATAHESRFATATSGCTNNTKSEWGATRTLFHVRCRQFVTRSPVLFVLLAVLQSTAFPSTGRINFASAQQIFGRER